MKKCFMCGMKIGTMDARCLTKDQYFLCYKDAKRLFPQNHATRLRISMKTAFFVQKHDHFEIANLLNETPVLDQSSNYDNFKRKSIVVNKLNNVAEKADKKSKEIQQAIDESESEFNSRLNIINKQLDNAGVSDLFGTKKEVKELPNIIDLDSEVIKYAASGIVENNTVLVVCTNKRIIFIDKGLVYGIKTSVIPLDMINGVSYSKGLVLGSISVTNGANTTLIENIQKQPAEILANTIKKEAANFKKNESVIASNDLASQLRELKELVDEGILTEDEFNAKKKQLLNL